MASQPTQLSEAANRRAHLKEVTNETVPDSLGTELRAARQKLGIEVKDVSSVTKIKPEYLEALEEGRLEALPGRTYAIGFLRTYASFLQLDAAGMVARLRAEEPVDKVAELIQGSGLPEPQREMRIPQGALIIVGIIIIALIYAGVYLFRSANEYMEQRAHPSAQTPVQPLGPAPDSQPAPSLAPRPLAPIGTPVTATPQVEGGVVDEAKPAEPAASNTSSTNESAAAPVVVRGSETSRSTPAAKPAPTPPTPKPVEPSGQTNAHAPAPKVQASGADQPAPTAPSTETAEAPALADNATGTGVNYERAVAAAPASFGAAAKDSRVMLRATDTVFLRIETGGPRDQVLFEGTLNKGEVYHVPKGAGVVLTTRNGGAVDVYVDKADKGTAGPAGIALKGLPLDPSALISR